MHQPFPDDPFHEQREYTEEWWVVDDKGDWILFRHFATRRPIGFGQVLIDNTDGLYHMTVHEKTVPYKAATYWWN